MTGGGKFCTCTYPGSCSICAPQREGRLAALREVREIIERRLLKQEGSTFRSREFHEGALIAKEIDALIRREEER